MGWPWASNINNSLERNSTEGLNPLGHQASLPRLNRFWQSQKPLASYTNSFTEVRMRLVKTNTVPLNGSSSSFFRQRVFKPSIPFLKSTGSTASNNRCWGGNLQHRYPSKSSMSFDNLLIGTALIFSILPQGR